MHCGSCGFANPDGMNFCGKCAASLTPRCPQCGFENPSGFAFCGKCATPLAGQPASPPSSAAPLQPLAPTRAEAERRHLTVMFCDLVGSTALSAQLDPEDLRQLVRQYQQTCGQVIQRHDGYLAQYLGDGLLVYFGYPLAHEDDAARAVRTGLGIVEELQQSNIEFLRPLQVRIGIHTGLVVIGDIGVGSRTEQLALGETPNVAARIQGFAEPDTVLISAATQRLIEGQFECQSFGSHLLKGIDTPIAIYQVQSERQGASLLAERISLTPLVGREQEVGLLVDRWEQVKEGRGQVVLLSGEPGIGKSRLAYTLREHVTAEGSSLFEAPCSPYHQHSALYPLIEVLQRTLLLTRQDTDDEKVSKLERALAFYGMPEAVPLFTALLSLPTPSQYPPLNLTPQKQKERTLQALLQLLVAQAERQATVSVWEDLHWVDPSSLEFLSLLVEQIPTTKLLLVLTFRPEFIPPWRPRSHMSHLVLNRLGRTHVETMIEKVTADTALSAEVIEQIRIKTDGVPLFVEELTKSVVESVGATSHVPLQPLAIPATLQEALLARLDRLSTARQIAQLGATVGREFSRELIQAVAPLPETDLHAALEKLVEAEILYQRGLGEQTLFVFKHALIQDTAYQSLLKSTRQHYHHQIAKVLEARFPDTKETQPELMAHHYTKAGFIAQAIPYWQQAGQNATQRSAHAEAISHFTKGVELVLTLPDTPDRAARELELQLLRAVPLIASKGYAAERVRQTYERAQVLCEQIQDVAQLFRAWWGLTLFYTNTGDNRTSYQFATRCLELAEQDRDPVFLLQSHMFIGALLHWFGEFPTAATHLARAVALYDFERDHGLAFVYGLDPAMASLAYGSATLWLLGYPDQAQKQAHEALHLAEKIVHPFSQCFALSFIALIHLFRREGPLALRQATALAAFAQEHLFSHYMNMAMLIKGLALIEQGNIEEGTRLADTARQALKATGATGERSFIWSLRAEGYRKAGEIEQGVSLVIQGLSKANEGSDRQAEAELYRLKGELTLQKEVREWKQELRCSSSKAPNQQGKATSNELQATGPNGHSLIPDAHGEAEGYFFKAIEVACRQSAKSWELRAATSLSCLWQQQGKRSEAHKLLSEVYNWFTEGFDTRDLREAKALLDELGESL